jgi:TonB family protein
MQEAVSGVLIDRSRESDGLSRMLSLSLAAHAVLLAALAFAPAGWFEAEVAPRPNAITISLGGVPGQDTGGMTSIASRTVQAVTPPNARAEVTPPAAKPPEMVAPSPDVKPKPVPPVTKPVDKASARKPTTGAEIKTGPARADTGGAEVPFGGLAQGGGGQGGPRVVGDFCCPDYLAAMDRAIRSNWNQNQGARGEVEVKFTIRRDGMLAAVAVEKSSGNPLLDLESRRAVHATQRIAPLPDRYTLPSLTVYLTFEYKR